MKNGEMEDAVSLLSDCMYVCELLNKKDKIYDYIDFSPKLTFCTHIRSMDFPLEITLTQF